ncbi:Protein of unknown function (DUF1349) [Seminavis robusta]|uniref:DUF1349 domain-containing protein n=1 Tax=Seminavis robusta TaxID=568900 RepID=A0A9N8DP82_9STRA|nr:Protein of unknown function (DUF1349) [Seminavis robusta]|eukprot:Sro241_g096380.1 Protein of unknown function (DUF1349) (325) ;mRNA; f:51052-52026
MAAKKPVKFFWTHLSSRKDGKEKDGVIKLKVPSQTHVWRHTDEDGSVNNSPYYFRKVAGDFEATVKVTAKMSTWLDQCGILLQEKRGIYTKVSLEYHEPPDGGESGLRTFACCYVHPEEWQFERSLSPYPGQFHRGDPKYSHAMLDGGANKVWLKLSRLEGYIEANYSLDGEDWQELKAAKFSDAETLSIGVFGASPGGDTTGFKCSFENFEVVEDEDVSESEEEELPEEESVAEEEEAEEEVAEEEEEEVEEEFEDYEEEEGEVEGEEEEEEFEDYEEDEEELSQGEVFEGSKLGEPPSLGIAGMDSESNFEAFEDFEDEDSE